MNAYSTITSTFASTFTSTLNSTESVYTNTSEDTMPGNSTSSSDTSSSMGIQSDLAEFLSDPRNLLTPVATSMLLYSIASVVAIIEYHSTLSQKNSNSTSIPHQSSHSNLRMGEVDDGRYAYTGAGRARNGAGGRRGGGGGAQQRDSSPSDIGDSLPNHSAGDHNNANTNTNFKSPGEENRRLFYKYLMLSLILRLILLPIQRRYSDQSNNNVTITVSRSLPTLTSMISYTILICFYARVTFMASGKPNNANILKWFQESLVQIVYGIYASIIFFNSVIPTISNKWFDILVWGMLCIYHFALFVSMSYFGFSLVSILKSNLTGGLGLRLVGMCMICTIMFSFRSTLEGLEVLNSRDGISYGTNEEGTNEFSSNPNLIPQNLNNGEWGTLYGREVTGYLTLEWLPAILVLCLMHKSNNTDNNTASSSNANGTGARQRNAIGDDAVAAMEGGHYSPMDPTLDQYGQQQPFMDTKAKNGNMGVKRSFSANGSMAIPISTRTMMQQQQQQASGQRVMAGSYGVLKTGPGGRGETTSLLGERSISAIATTHSYGAAQMDD